MKVTYEVGDAIRIQQKYLGILLPDNKYLVFFEEGKGLIRPSVMGNFTNDDLFPVEKHYLNTLSLEAKYIIISVLTLLDVDSNHISLSTSNLRDTRKG